MISIQLIFSVESINNDEKRLFEIEKSLVAAKMNLRMTEK